MDARTTCREVTLVGSNDMARPRLADCTKAELIQIIKHLTNGADQDLRLARALDYIWYQRTDQRMDRADALAKRADEARRRYIALLAPYEGKRLMDIPASVLDRGQRLLDEARKADKEWARLMGIDGEGGA